jgi:hypothetical protein
VELLIIAGVDISHLRLVDLTQLADQAKPFYDWVERIFQQATGKDVSLNELLLIGTPEEIRVAITACYQVAKSPDIPFLFDGVGRTYLHQRACYYFFSWLIRDAPQQRLAPLIRKVSRSSQKSKQATEIEVLTALICEYRSYVKTFSWDAIREVIIDRLEGSRRSVKGHEKEIVVRTALIIAIQTYFERYRGYGAYASVEISDRQVSIHNETYDVSANLINEQSKGTRRILIPIKTRETEGGGHSHLFSRDIFSAINTARIESPEDYLFVVIVANQWSKRESDNLRERVDHLAVFEISPSQFASFDNEAQNSLNRFIANVFDQTLLPKRIER